MSIPKEKTPFPGGLLLVRRLTAYRRNWLSGEKTGCVAGTLLLLLLQGVALFDAHVAHRADFPRLGVGFLTHPEDAIEAEREALMLLCALYLMYHTTHPSGDSVGKFHLTNGATLFQINWAADVSKKGLQQSGGLMVNYLYELDKVEEQHEAFSHKTVCFSRGVEKLV